MADRARVWEIKVHDGGQSFVKHVSARTRSQARVAAWRDFDDAWGISFRDFLRIASVRAYGGPLPDCYAYVRRAYGVHVEIGERISVKGQGEGEVAYPGTSSTHRVHVLFDGINFPLQVHPTEVVQTPSRAGEAAHAG